VDHEPVARAHVGTVGECVESGHEPTAQAGHLHRGDALGQGDEVVVGVGNGDLLGERARCLGLEAQRQPVLTDVRVAAPTEVTSAVAEVERDGDVVALGEVGYLRAGFEDVPGGFVTQDVPGHGIEAAPVPVALPGVPVAAADPAGLDGHDGAVGIGVGRVDLPDLKRFAVVGKRGGAHAGETAGTVKYFRTALWIASRPAVSGGFCTHRPSGQV